MKYLLLSAMVLFSTAASAQDELVGLCRTAVEAEGGNADGCPCLIERVNENPIVFEELMGLSSVGGMEERYDAASDDLKEILDECELSEADDGF